MDRFAAMIILLGMLVVSIDISCLGNKMVQNVLLDAHRAVLDPPFLYS